MTTSLRLAAAGGILLAGTMAFSQSAFSAPLCSTYTTVQEWVTGGGICDDQDKRYEYGFTDLAALDDLGLQVKTNVGPPDTHQFTIDPDPNVNATGNYVFKYTVEIFTGDLVFSAVGLSQEISSFDPNVTTVKWVSNNAFDNNNIATLSVSGSDSTTAPLCLNCKKLWVTDYIAIGQGAGGAGDLISFTNEYRQTEIPVPEPMTTALFGLGLAGIGFARRRKTA